MSDDGTAWVSWMSKANQSTESAFKVKQLSASGEILFEETIAMMNASRRSGFPQMAATSKGFLFAWTDLDEDNNPSLRFRLLQN